MFVVCCEELVLRGRPAYWKGYLKLSLGLSILGQGRAFLEALGEQLRAYYAIPELVIDTSAA